VAGQQVSEHIPGATNMHATIEELLYMSFSMRSMSYQSKVGDYFFPELLVSTFASLVYGLQLRNLDISNSVQNARW
jgi:hypothetical protein